MTEVEEAIAAEIAAMPESLRQAAMKLADLAGARQGTTDLLKALRTDGFVVFEGGTIEASPRA